MSEERFCPKIKKCPIFSGEGLKREQSKQTYKNLYCEAGNDRYGACKRYIISEKTGKSAPASILPNSSLEIDEIIKMMES